MNVTFAVVISWMAGVVRGKARKEVSMMSSQFIADIAVEWKEVSSKLMWMKGSEINEREREEFWSSLDECLQRFVVVLEDLNAGVGNDCMDGVDKKFRVSGRNGSEERLIAMWNMS